MKYIICLLSRPSKVKFLQTLEDFDKILYDRTWDTASQEAAEKGK